HSSAVGSFIPMFFEITRTHLHNYTNTKHNCGTINKDTISKKPNCQIWVIKIIEIIIRDKIKIIYSKKRKARTQRAKNHLIFT
ncbi:MAG: hypothetical protein ACT6FC_05995, partial [Methanosarcinaceae archaeon]